MAVETKPLFHPEVIRQHLRAFTLPQTVEAAQPRLQHWANLISSGKADTFKETALLPEFITDIFGQLLGYSGPAGPTDIFTLSRETHVEVDGQFADAALGRFTSESKKITRVPTSRLMASNFYRGGPAQRAVQVSLDSV